MPENVRLATPSDEGALFDVLMALNADNGFGVPASPEKIIAQIRVATRREGGLGVIGIIENGSRIDGTIGIFVDQMWYTDRYHLSERWLFVRPDARNGKIHDDLFMFAEWTRAAMQSGGSEPWIVVTSVSSPRRLDAKTRLWRRYARQVGAIFYMGAE